MPCPCCIASDYFGLILASLLALKTICLTPLEGGARRSGKALALHSREAFSVTSLGIERCRVARKTSYKELLTRSFIPCACDGPFGHLTPAFNFGLEAAKSTAQGVCLTESRQ